MTGRLLRLAPIALAFALLQGCLSMVIDAAKLEADMPLAPPPFRPDSARIGSLLAQASLKLTPGSRDVDTTSTWKDFPVGGSFQVQQIWGEHWRGVVGGGFSRSASAWVGAVAGIRTETSNWDMDLLVGFTEVRYGIGGHVEGDDNDDDVNYPLSTSGKRVSPWSQFALRWSARGSGPYLEERTVLLHWSALRDTSKYDVDPVYVGTSVSCLGGGWKWERPGGSILSAGARFVQAGKSIEGQLLLQFQLPIF